MASPSRILAAIVALACIAAIVQLIVVTALRIGFPYDLEWIEGGLVDVVERIARGGRLYIPPTVEEIGFVYTPLYFYLSAAVSWLVGPGYLGPRLLSFTSMVLALGLLYRTSARETGDRVAGLAAAGLYAAFYDACGAWYDVARVDSLMILLLLSSLHLLRFHEGPAAMAAAGFLLGLGYLTKQSVIGFVPASLLIAFSRGVRPGAAFAAGATLSLGAIPWGLERLWDGWYSYWTVQALTGQARLLSRVQWYVRDLFLPRFWPLLVLSVAGVTWLVARREWRRALFHGLSAGSAVVLVIASTSKTGGDTNLMMPTAAVLAPLGALALHAALRVRRESAPGARAVALLAPGAILVQLALVAYDPRARIPTASDRASGDRFVELLRSIDGPVLVPFHGYVPTLAGKHSFSHLAPVEDCIKGDNQGLGLRLKEAFVASVVAQRYSAIVLDTRWFVREIGTHYEKVRDIPPEEALPMPRTGWQVRPTSIWVPRKQALPPPARRATRAVSAQPIDPSPAGSP